MKTDEFDKLSYAEPDPILTEKPSFRKYVKYLSFFGPGAIVASVTIGQGQLILGPQIGAWAGFALLWLITINVGSYILAYVGCRFTMISGIGLMDLFAIKTRNGWINKLFIVIMLIFIPIFTATIITSLGQAISWVFGFGHYLIWGVSFCLLAGILVLYARYKFLEYTQAFFVAVLAIGAVISVISIKPDLFEILPNFITIGQNVPVNYPEWVVNDYPSVTNTPIPLVMLGYLGTLSFTILTIIGYVGWIKVKKWGIFRDRIDSNSFSQKCLKSFSNSGKITYLPDDKNEIKKSRILLKPIKIDLLIAFIAVSIISAAYMIAGTYLLGPERALPEDSKLIQNQVIIFTYMADWLKPLFQVSVIFALFGTVYAGFEAATRMLYETGKGISKKINNVDYNRFMLYVLIFLLFSGTPIAILMLMGLSVILMLSLTLMFVGVIGVIMYGIGAIYLSQKVLPKNYKLGKIGLILSIIALFFMMIPIILIFI